MSLKVGNGHLKKLYVNYGSIKIKENKIDEFFNKIELALLIFLMYCHSNGMATTSVDEFLTYAI